MLEALSITTHCFQQRFRLDATKNVYLGAMDFRESSLKWNLYFQKEPEGGSLPSDDDHLQWIQTRHLGGLCPSVTPLPEKAFVGAEEEGARGSGHPPAAPGKRQCDLTEYHRSQEISSLK